MNETQADLDARVSFTTTQCTECQGWEQHVHVTGFMTDDGLVTSDVEGLTNLNHERECPNEAGQYGHAALAVAVAEIDKLRKIISDAPHADNCPMRLPTTMRIPEDLCSCWKAAIV